MMFLYLLLSFFTVLIFWAILVFNRLVRLKNHVKNAWAQIDVQLQRRYDLIPNLIEAVKGYMKHEKETLEAVINARNSALSAKQTVDEKGGPTDTSLDNLMKADMALTGALGRIFALAESYPDLKANENMIQLQEELKSTENKVAFSRQAYNDEAMIYNTAQEVFPTNMVAKVFGHHKADLYEVSDASHKEPIKVKF